MQRAIGFALGLWFAGAALATGNFTDCRDVTNVSSGVTNSRSVGKGAVLCYQFDDATDSPKFEVNAISGLICFDPDAVGTGGAARVEPETCPYGIPGSSANQCIPIVSAPLSGTGGDSSTQNACIRVARGLYRIDVTSAPGAGSEKAVVTITGEE